MEFKRTLAAETWRSVRTAPPITTMEPPLDCTTQPYQTIEVQKATGLDQVDNEPAKFILCTAGGKWDRGLKHVQIGAEKNQPSGPVPIANVLDS